jgi:hypothetical protein
MLRRLAFLLPLLLLLSAWLPHGGGTGVSGSGTTTLTINSTVANFNSALGTLTVNNGTVGSDTIYANAVDNLGGHAIQKSIAVTANSSSTPPVITVPGSQSVTVSTSTGISGVSVADTNAGLTSISVTLQDTNGLLSATGTGISGSGTTSMTINSSLSNVNTALGTLPFESSTVGSDTIVLNAVDNLGNHATQQTIPVTVNSSGGGNTYYVAAAGSDSNNGTSPSTPWQTIAHVNAASLGSSPTVLFHGGDTFSGGIVVNYNNETIGSYGTGQPIISSGAITMCVYSHNFTNTSVNNLDCQGAGLTTNSTNGILVLNDQSGNTQLSGPTITNNTISGYGISGVMVAGNNGLSGYTGVNITGNTISNATGNSGTFIITACLYVGDYYPNGNDPDGGSGATGVTMNNVTISNNLVYNCAGYSFSNSGGSGIQFNDTNTAIVEYNTVHHVGYSYFPSGGQGSSGIWTFGTSGATIQYNEVYDAEGGNVDGDGIDLDGGSSDSVVQYNYVHGNNGAGLYGCDYGAPSTFWGNNTFRFNVTENNMTNWSGRGEMTIGGCGAARGAAITFTTIRFSRTTTRNMASPAAETRSLPTISSTSIRRLLFRPVCR